MKFFRFIQSVLIFTTLLGLTAALGTELTGTISDILLIALMALFLVWGFHLWRKIKSKEEKNDDHDAFLWLRIILYSCIVSFPIVKINSHHIDISDVTEAAIIAAYILFPFLGTSLSILRLRKDYRN